ncbi:putative nuclease HARBI1 isoform X2 [Aricia agestis]|uniref:putative nuclease HARBI1 isoform X2 n=1 Tax=Aricia agestis TaxID=91739 RepID=UPI001C20929B|nr:putative nuclease HARBI1 isoform X2 [Aricia agestis]XP_041981562.1 putative nuclease HARBI1 [Aricia agestis]XP_041982266.1 putative nuclease HARBI1 isoform X2 [Aricia agestis]XP_041985979.1 putative nuclease HARBI1 isoform X2 [Aricia agestis]
MCDEELILFEFLEADSEENSMRRRRLDARAQFDPFDLEDNEFIKRYRLSKELVVGLCDEIRPAMKAPRRSTDISVETKVLTALSFYATGSYQRPVGDISAHSMAQQTVSSVIAQVTACIDSVEMRKKYITFPKSNDERNEIRVRFYHKFGIPGVVGCIDCTQIAIVRPNRNEERYFCRKHYHSLNVQLICDADMQIISVDASFGGATHDSFIWNDHPIKQHLENLQESTWLLARLFDICTSKRRAACCVIGGSAGTLRRRGEKILRGGWVVRSRRAVGDLRGGVCGAPAEGDSSACAAPVACAVPSGPGASFGGGIIVLDGPGTGSGIKML